MVVPLVIVAGLADWLFHLDSVIRAALLAALVGRRLATWSIAACSARCSSGSPISTSRMRIEERWPGLNDRLASTIQFLQLDADDDRYGSPALREATVRQAVEETSTIDFREVIEPRPVIRALGVAARRRSGRRPCLLAGARRRRGSP